jgi:hypothetical protein
MLTGTDRGIGPAKLGCGNDLGPRKGDAWPLGPVWLFAPCSTDGLGGVTAGPGALLDR